MTESDERLDRVSDKIDDAKGTAKSLAESDVIDPGVVEGEVPPSGDEVTGPHDGTDVRGPFRTSPRSLLHGEASILPRPPWFVTNRSAATTARALTRFATRPGWARLPKILASALRG